MAYHLKEIYFTLQGEGAQAGDRAVFCRFSGCNLWNGREEDRAKSKCDFCDTDILGTDGPLGGVYQDAKSLVRALDEVWSEREGNRFVVFTGGEPLLQLDEELLKECKLKGFRTAVETNGTQLVPTGVDWITVSPKPHTTLKQIKGNELKLVYPTPRAPEEFESLQFEHFYLSPLWTNERKTRSENISQAIRYCELHPRWRISLQLHKMLGIP